MTRRVSAVIFDMDGVLIDARNWHYEAFNRALSQFGYSIGSNDHDQHYNGLPTRRKLALLSIAVGLPLELHGPISSLKQRYTVAIIREQCRVDPVRAQVLAFLRERQYRIAVASNAIRATVDLMLARSGLGANVEFALSNDDVANPKPDPEIHVRAMQRLSVTPHRCLVVEDSHVGIYSARAAGAKVFAIRSVEDITIPAITTAIAAIDERRECECECNA